MINNNIEDILKIPTEDLDQWFDKQFRDVGQVIYASIDIRDSGNKIVPIDTNLFPAGFNNLTSQEVDLASGELQNFIDTNYANTRKILLIAESHTRNLNYIQNLDYLVSIIKKAGFEIRVGNLEIEEEIEFPELPHFRNKIYPIKISDNYIESGGKVPDLVLLNNDLSKGLHKSLDGIKQPIIPHVMSGWFNRKKSDHLKSYNVLLEKFCNDFDLDKFYFSADYEACGKINFKAKTGLDCVANAVDKLLFRVEKNYIERGISQKAYAYIKAEKGTYGMGIMHVNSGKEIYSMNKKLRNKMDVIKGGQKNTEVVIQEGIESAVKYQDSNAELMIYTVNSKPISFIMRYHEEKSSFGNLNSPGLKFENISAIKNFDKNRHTIYAILAKIAVLAAAKEIQYS